MQTMNMPACLPACMHLADKYYFIVRHVSMNLTTRVAIIEPFKQLQMTHIKSGMQSKDYDTRHWKTFHMRGRRMAAIWKRHSRDRRLDIVTYCSQTIDAENNLLSFSRLHGTTQFYRPLILCFFSGVTSRPQAPRRAWRLHSPLQSVDYCSAWRKFRRFGACASGG
jgi:hypothetical protein